MDHQWIILGYPWITYGSISMDYQWRCMDNPWINNDIPWGWGLKISTLFSDRWEVSGQLGASGSIKKIIVKHDYG